jgi:hypothetical protein
LKVYSPVPQFPANVEYAERGQGPALLFVPGSFGTGAGWKPVMERLDRLLERRTFLLGEALTLADITAGTSLYRYFELEIERPRLAQVERWYRTLRQRPAFRTHVMIAFDELRGRLDY